MKEPTGEVQAVVGHLNEAHGMEYRVQRRLAGGYQNGAYELRSRRDGRAVLKVSADPAWAPRVVAAAPLVERARAAGWPTPAWLFVGATAGGWPFGRPGPRGPRQQQRANASGKVVAVVDMEALGKGHRVSDYACLLREGYMDDADRTVLRRLRDIAEAGAGPQR